ncbi:MAG: hypothetical protein HON70_21825, partial [Lentisphaerae bacterium]|nr:hypothetical protein [Lentisphaerota bacterium]
MRLPRTLAAILWSLNAVFAASAQVQPTDASAQYISDLIPQGAITCTQQWGTLGLDVAAYGNGPKMPIRIVNKTFKKGIGHHAKGRIAVPLSGAFLAFRSQIGVQWQGGKRGSVRFRILVDGKTAFEHGPMSDSSPAVPIDIPLTGANELCLLAENNGDGIGCDMATWAEARLIPDPDAPVSMIGRAKLTINGQPPPQPSSRWANALSIVAAPGGPQLLLTGDPVREIDAILQDDEEVRVTIPVNCSASIRLAAEVALCSGTAAQATLAVGNKRSTEALRAGQTVVVMTSLPTAANTELVLSLTGTETRARVRLSQPRYQLADRSWQPLPLRFEPPPREQLPPTDLPEFRPELIHALIESDWRMHDGVNSPRESITWQEATETVLASGDRLVAELTSREVMPEALLHSWQACHNKAKALGLTELPPDRQPWQALWSRVHNVRRRIVLANPDVPEGPILFAKQVPSGFSHQLTQYYGMWARPGGGLFVLEAPGRTMACRELTAEQLPIGSYQHPELSYDGKRILFAYCALDKAETKNVAGWKLKPDAYYQLYEIATDGTGLRRVTDNPSDDFFPVYLPSGRILFSSTRRGGYHRCGHGPCPVYTLTSINPDGSGVRILSCHETQEWDPAVLNDGRVIYTRWDYVDRNAVYYQQLWTTRPDGTAPSEFYGNYL